MAFRRGGADAGVDVEAVRLGAELDHFGAQFVKHVRGDVVGGAVGAVDHDLQAAQVEFVREGALAEFDVAALGVAQAGGAAQLVGRHAAHRLVDLLRFRSSTASGSLVPCRRRT
jgi:hypothetical protein